MLGPVSLEILTQPASSITSPLQHQSARAKAASILQGRHVKQV